MRVIISIAVIGAVIAVFFLQTEEPSDPTPDTSQTAQAILKDDDPRTRRVAKERVQTQLTEKKKAATAPQGSSEAAQPEAEEQAAETPKGPFTIQLGQHTIQLKDDARKRAVQFQLQLVTQTDETRKEIRRRRKDLVRMAYFLGSKRQADGAVGVAGRTRFERDLLDRFQNVVRSGSIDALKLANYRVFSRAKDAGVE